MPFTPSQFQKLSDITADLGQVVIASAVVPFFLDKARPSVALLGMMLATMCWLTSLLLLTKRDNDV